MRGDYPKFLAIAGSDPSGGAGIEADIKTATSLKVFTLSIITSITVQNTMGVKDKFDTQTEIIEKQLQALTEDIDFSIVKISMIGKKENIAIFKKFLKDKFIIFDPVLFSKNNFPLIEMEYVNDLISICNFITPNFYELKQLAKVEDSPENMALNLMKKYKNLKAILIKGGHINENEKIITDTLIINENGYIKLKTFRHSRIKTNNLHGTGCTLASAIASYIAKGESLTKATEKGIKYLQKIIKLSSNYKIGNGTGPLVHLG